MPPLRRPLLLLGSAPPLFSLEFLLGRLDGLLRLLELLALGHALLLRRLPLRAAAASVPGGGGAGAGAPADAPPGRAGPPGRSPAAACSRAPSSPTPPSLAPARGGGWRRRSPVSVSGPRRPGPRRLTACLTSKGSAPASFICWTRDFSPSSSLAYIPSSFFSRLTTPVLIFSCRSVSPIAAPPAGPRLACLAPPPARGRQGRRPAGGFGGGGRARRAGERERIGREAAAPNPATT